MNSPANEDPLDFVRQIVGLPCWQVAACDATGLSFSLALGGKRPFPQPLVGRPTRFRYPAYWGECDLLVWCPWRLEHRAQLAASSDQAPATFIPKLEQLVGEKITDVGVREPAWDLTVESSNDSRLIVFSEYLPPNPTLSTNWEVSVSDKTLYVEAESVLVFGIRP